MLTLFYNKTTLHDTLIINVSNNLTIKVEHKDDFVYGFDGNNMITFINIFHLSNYLVLPEGYLYLSTDIANLILEKIGINLNDSNNVFPFVVGKVIECILIENTHLHFCRVDIQQEILSIVCGADNIRKDLLVVIARVDTIMPNGLLINRSKLMGYDSYGMICSVRELNLQKHQFNKEGIIELPNYFTKDIGKNFMDVFVNFCKK
ncbi:MAG: tRNA-binding protein [Mycoplasmataceae bacterium]|jgi:tRNA-binding protein|nr:tRNA-binding protein [Mycoplasmataceae bacterium]